MNVLKRSSIAQAATLLIGLLLLTGSVVLGPPVEASEGGKILPPHAYAYGRSLGDWLAAYWRWYYTIGGSEPYPMGPVVFMPLPVGEQISGDWTPDNPAYLKGELEVTLRPGTPFVLPLFAWVAERYEGYPGVPDDPSFPDELMPSIVTETEVTLDGKPILTNYWDYYIPTRWFDPIVVYPEPSSYGSVAALSFQGVGFVSAPLTPGTHKITLFEKYVVREGMVPPFVFGMIYDNTWIIHVVPPGKK